MENYYCNCGYEGEPKTFDAVGNTLDEPICPECGDEMTDEKISCCGVAIPDYPDNDFCPVCFEHN